MATSPFGKFDRADWKAPPHQKRPHLSFAASGTKRLCRNRAKRKLDLPDCGRISNGNHSLGKSSSSTDTRPDQPISYPAIHLLTRPNSCAILCSHCLHGGNIYPIAMNKETQQEDFKPRGAIAFFLIMAAFYVVLWAIFYFMMLGRQ